MTALRLPPGYVVAGKYSLRNPLGYAGATASYAAVTAAARNVVVKLYSPQLADRSDVLGALQRAATITNALPSDATAPILDVGFDPQTRSPFTVTDAIGTLSLLEAVKGGTFSLLDVAQLVAGMARAIDAAHAQRLAHGGLKPQNVFAGPVAPRAVRVLDFGINVARAALPTEEGRVLTVPWIAPEQLQAGPDGPAIDVFSAALVAFFAGTGRSYWRSCQGAAPDLTAWQRDIASARVPVSRRSREVGGAMPEEWDVVFDRALAPNPAERFASVAELARALETTALASGAAGAGVAPAPGAAPIATAPAAAAPVTAMATSPAGGDDVAETARSRKGLIVGLSILGGVAFIGVIGLALALRKPHTPSGPSGSASAARSAAPSATAAASVPTEAASAVASAEAPPPAPSDSAPAPAASDAPAGEMAQLTVYCMPGCDTITIDEDVLDAGLSDPQALSPGTHTVVATKGSFAAQMKKFTLKAGQREKTTFFFARPGPGPGPAPGPAKPCGKFLEKCP